LYSLTGGGKEIDKEKTTGGGHVKEREWKKRLAQVGGPEKFETEMKESGLCQEDVQQS